RSYLMLVMFYIGVRLGTSIYHPVGISWVSHSFRGNTLDRAMGIQSAFGNIGVLLAFISTGFLADAYGWRMPLYIWGSINLVVTVVGLLISRGTVSREEVIAQKEDEKLPISWGKAFRQISAFIPMMLLGGLAWGVMLNYSPSLLNHRLGMSMSKMGLVLGGWMCAGTFSALMYGRITGWITRRRTLIIAYATMTVASFILGSIENVMLVIGAFVLFGLALFTTYPSILSFVSLAIGSRDRTAGFALTANINILGNSIFAFISGHISDRFGIHSPFLLLGSVTLLVIGYMWALIRSGRIRAE
ncbi:MAG TPA: MFS transporter, partial [Candidatus Krumholzibacterium sp.]|nr:MFS transporter [Candidatus Krumholzibacterium sp.]